MDARRSPAGEHDGDWSAEFQKTRWRAWRKARWAVLILLGSFTATFWDPRFFFIGFVGAAGSIIWLTSVCTRNYVCPACGKIPMAGGAAIGAGGFSYDRGVNLDPELCSHCGVRLKPEPEVKRLYF